MRTLRLAVAGVVVVTAGVVSTLPNAADPAFAQSNRACLPNNRIWSTSVVDDRTLIVNDRFGNPFVVELSGGCQGLTETVNPRIRFNTRTNLGCLSRGDRVAFRHNTLGRNTCFVRNVHTDLTTLARGGRPAVRTAARVSR
jgi:Family of unknown function (DUF6491)